MRPLEQTGVAGSAASAEADGPEPQVPARGRGAGRGLTPATVVRLTLSVVVLTVLWSVAGPGTFAALSGSTANTGNTFSAGTVTLTDNDGGSTAMFTFTNQKPGVSEDGCIKVNYTGSVSAPAVNLYGTVTGTMAPYLNLTVTRGTDSTPAFDNCAAFVPDATNYNGLGAGVVYNGTLSGYPATYAAGLTDPVTPWTSSTSASYKFTVSVVDDNAVQGLTSGATFTWEARS